MESKKLYAIYHGYSVDGGYGDAIWEEEMTGLVWATQNEIDAYVKKYNKPVVYDHPYDDLVCHGIRAEEAAIDESLDQVKPYGEHDYYGQWARKYVVKQEFDKKYGHDWMWGDDRDKINPLYLEAMKKAEEEEETAW